MKSGLDNGTGKPAAIFAERIFDGRQWHHHAAVLIKHGRIRGITPWSNVSDTHEMEQLPPDMFLAPGFIDLQVNGGGRVLLNDTPTADAMIAIARAHRRFGTTALLPTFITDTREKASAAIAAAKAATGREGVIGLHLEGPFINPARAGVHRTEYIARAEMRDLDWLSALSDVAYSVITLAPERVPSGFIRELAALGIRVCVGHSEASADAMRAAMDEGLTGVTHLFNAMPPFGGRAPGIVGTAFADARLTAGLIVDGLHVHPISVLAAFAAKGADRVALVTDAMPTVGADISQFDLMGRRIYLRDGRLVTEDGTLAGAHLDMASAVRNVVGLAQVPLDDALISTTHTPASFLALEHERGALVPGARADIVALTHDIRVAGTWVSGVRQL